MPFSHDALALIARASRGIPRLVNCICDNALLLAYASEKRVIGPSQIYSVLRDLDLGENPVTAVRAEATAGKRLRLRDLDKPAKGSELPRIGGAAANGAAEGAGLGNEEPVPQKPDLATWAEEMNVSSARTRRLKNE